MQSVLSHGSFCRPIIWAILVTFTAACTSMRTIPVVNKENVASQISIGDQIEVAQNDGEISNFVVSMISDSGIGGDGYFVEYDDIEQVRVAPTTDSTDNQKWVWLIIGLALLAAAIDGAEPAEIRGY